MRVKTVASSPPITRFSNVPMHSRRDETIEPAPAKKTTFDCEGQQAGRLDRGHRQLILAARLSATTPADFIFPRPKQTG
jgi:hypothetical protein